MTDQEPTPEELKKFWEWCGFKHGVPFPELAKRIDILHPERFTEEQWYLPGVYCGEMPARTLDNLFKYAVPKMESMGYLLFLHCYKFPPRYWVGFNKIELVEILAPLTAEKYALAIFRAIQGAIKGSLIL